VSRIALFGLVAQRSAQFRRVRPSALTRCLLSWPAPSSPSNRLDHLLDGEAASATSSRSRRHGKRRATRARGGGRAGGRGEGGGAGTWSGRAVVELGSGGYHAARRKSRSGGRLCVISPSSQLRDAVPILDFSTWLPLWRACAAARHVENR
jgi:hypothetical protein